MPTFERCVSCRLYPEVCVCAYAPRLHLSTRVVVIIHRKEWCRTSNTGHLTRLAVHDSEVRLHGLPHRPVTSAGIDAGAPSTLVLYPGRGARPLTPQYVAALPRPLTLLVPDGNWNQANKMMCRLPILRQAQPIRLDGPSLDFIPLRQNFYADRMSTFEAIAQALGILEGHEAQEQLLDFFQMVLGRMIPNSRIGQP